MAHCRLLFVGTKNNLEQIYWDCPDSSSETDAEMAFGADYITDDYWFNDEFNINDEHYADVVEGRWVYCFDIRDTKHFGDYGCINNLGTQQCNEDEYKRLIIEHLRTLPEDTVFFFQDSHW